MRIVDRLAIYLAYKKITPYSFEHSVDVANGYLKKQLKGKGSIGSDILQRIYLHYPELDFIWLLTGEGEMLRHDIASPAYYPKEDMISVLRARISLLEASLADKEKIISLLQ